MGVQLNIKDEATVRLARSLADATGKSVTETIRIALEEQAARREEAVAAKLARIQATVAGARGLWDPALDGMELSTRHGELLYNEDGSFK